MFEQKIIKGFPPNYMTLKRHFPCTQDTIFSYGDRIYRPNGKPIPKPLIVHEGVHGERQTALGVTIWWFRYTQESAFRFEEELVAHRAEWKSFVDSPLGHRADDRDRMLDQIAARLSGPLYGGLISFERAKGMIV